MKKIIALFVFMFLSLFVFTACDGSGGSGQFWKSFTEYDVTKVDVSNVNFVNQGKLTVAMSTDFAPFEFVDTTKKGQNKYVGSDVALAKEIAKAFGVELEIKAMGFDETLVALDNGIADVAISGFSYTVARAASYLYTDCYYDEGDGGQVIVIKKADENKFTSIASMNVAGVKIAAQNGALQQDLVTKFTPNATLVKIDDLNSAYDTLKAGSVDGVAVAQTVADALVASDSVNYAIMAEPFDFKDTGSFCLVKQGNTILAEAINKVIQELSSKKAYEKWVDEGTNLFTGLGDKAQEIVPEDD